MDEEFSNILGRHIIIEKYKDDITKKIFEEILKTKLEVLLKNIDVDKLINTCNKEAETEMNKLKDNLTEDIKKYFDSWPERYEQFELEKSKYKNA